MFNVHVWFKLTVLKVFVIFYGKLVLQKALSNIIRWKTHCIWCLSRSNETVAKIYLIDVHFTFLIRYKWQYRSLKDEDKNGFIKILRQNDITVSWDLMTRSEDVGDKIKTLIREQKQVRLVWPYWNTRRMLNHLRQNIDL